LVVVPVADPVVAVPVVGLVFAHAVTVSRPSKATPTSTRASLFLGRSWRQMKAMSGTFPRHSRRPSSFGPPIVRDFGQPVGTQRPELRHALHELARDEPLRS
jgi:hypothetical protein